jgi:hypothetical protein
MAPVTSDSATSADTMVFIMLSRNLNDASSTIAAGHRANRYGRAEPALLCRRAQATAVFTLERANHVCVAGLAGSASFPYDLLVLAARRSLARCGRRPGGVFQAQLCSVCPKMEAGGAPGQQRRES